MKILEKLTTIIGKMNGLVLLALALGIVLVVFIIGLMLALGGDLGKFKSIAKRAIAKPTMANFQVTAKEMPVKVRKQYKKVKQTGEKPSDGITIDACVYSPYQIGMASRFPTMVTVAGILSIFLAFFLAPYTKNIQDKVYLIPALVTVCAMVLRLAAGLISSALLKGGVKVYEKYVETLDKNMRSGPITEDQPEQPPMQQQAYGATFEEPTHISVELADEEPAPAYEPVVEPVMTTAAEESEADFRERARAEAMAQARAAQAQAQAQAQPQPQPQPQPQAQPVDGGASAVDELVARINTIIAEGGNVQQMREVAMQVQKERGKPENKAPETQRKLNEALMALLQAMKTKR